MTIKSFNQGSLSLSEIQAEFGGSNPIGLNEYYAGGGLVNSGTVGYPSGSAVSIPSSGAISISNFYGASAEPNAVALANYFWNNRSNFVRYSDFPPINYYPGDNWSRNVFNARYTSSFTNSWTYSNSYLPLSSMFYTLVSVAVGAIGNYPSITPSTSTGSLLHQFGPFTFVGDGVQPTPVGNGFGINVITQTFVGQVNSVTSNSITSSHAGGNRGAWAYSYLIPGKWTFEGSGSQVNFDGYNYSRTVGAGKMHFMFVERGGDYPNPLPQPSGAANVITADNWWYNGSSVQLVVNTSSSAINPSWPASGPIIGETPIVGAILTNF
jgi:hypothetical protein